MRGVVRRWKGKREKLGRRGQRSDGRKDAGAKEQTRGSKEFACSLLGGFGHIEEGEEISAFELGIQGGFAADHGAGAEIGSEEWGNEFVGVLFNGADIEGFDEFEVEGEGADAVRFERGDTAGGVGRIVGHQVVLDDGDFEGVHGFDTGAAEHEGGAGGFDVFAEAAPEEGEDDAFAEVFVDASAAEFEFNAGEGGDGVHVELGGGVEVVVEGRAVEAVGADTGVGFFVNDHEMIAGSVKLIKINSEQAAFFEKFLIEDAVAQAENLVKFGRCFDGFEDKIFELDVDGYLTAEGTQAEAIRENELAAGAHHGAQHAGFFGCRGRSGFAAEDAQGHAEETLTHARNARARFGRCACGVWCVWRHARPLAVCRSLPACQAFDERARRRDDIDDQRHLADGVRGTAQARIVAADAGLDAV